jgi:hypothetical protein
VAMSAAAAGTRPCARARERPLWVRLDRSLRSSRTPASRSPADIRHDNRRTRANAVDVPPPMVFEFGANKIRPDKFWARKNEFLLGEILRCVGSRTADPTGPEGWSMVGILFRIVHRNQLEHRHQRRAADAAKRSDAAKETPLDTGLPRPNRFEQRSRDVALLAVGCDHACRAEEALQVDGHLRTSRWLTVEATRDCTEAKIKARHNR